jgi:hypothetical protein
MALITGININNTTLRTGATNLPIQVVGDSDAIFSVQVTRSSDSRFYDFKTRTFAATVTSQSRLINQSPGVFTLAIPAAASGDTYTIIIMAEPHYNTALSIGNGIRYATTVTQKGNATITFAALGEGTLLSTSIGTSTGSPLDRFSSAGSPTVTMKDLQLNIQAAVADYGFFITTTNKDLDKNNGTWNASALYWESGNYTASGGGTDSTSLTLTSVDGLVVGMQVAKINSVYQSDLRAITAINTDTKTVTLDGNETWSDTHVIIFRAYGPRIIKNAISIGLSLTNPTVRLGQLTTTLDDEITSNVSEDTEFNVNGTLGIGKGATIRMRGLEKSLDTGAATIVGVDSSSNGGGIAGGAIGVTNARILASSDRPIRTKTKIYIDGCSNKIYLNGTISINKYPEANQNIYIDTNKILTVGTAL